MTDLDMDKLVTTARSVGYSEAVTDVIEVLAEYSKTFDPKASVTDLVELLIAKLDMLNRKGPTKCLT